MTTLGSILFNGLFFAWTTSLVLILWVLMPFSSKTFRKGIRLWPRGIIPALRLLAGISYEIRGAGNLPAGAVIYAVKHQSTWETMFFLLLDGETSYTMKGELLRIPLWGWYMRKAENIAVERLGGAAAMRHMIRETRTVLEAGRSVVIFPEGTRTPPGETGHYHPGVAALYAQTGYPVVPVALNSGLYWARRSFRKNAGTIIMEYQPPIPAGLERKAFMAALEDSIETATRRLELEARGEAGAP